MCRLRRLGHPRLRWVDGIRIRDWKAAALNREDWRKMNEEAKAYWWSVAPVGCSYV